TFEDTDFTTPTGSLTIYGGAGNDTFNVISAAGLGSLTIDGEGGSDLLYLPASLTVSGSLAASAEITRLGANITTTAGAITFNGEVQTTNNVVLNTSAGGGNITFNGSVSAAQASSKNLTLTAGTGNI